MTAGNFCSVQDWKASFILHVVSSSGVCMPCLSHCVCVYVRESVCVCV